MDWTDAGLQVLYFALPILSAVLIAVLTALAKKWAEKLGVERSEKIDDMIDRYVELAVRATEKVAANKLASNVKMSSEDKLGLAVKTVLDELEQSGIKGVTEAVITARIEAFLEGKKA